MSKAFTKDEGEGSESAEVELDPLAALPPGAKNYMTQAGFQKLQAEIGALLEKRHGAGGELARIDRKIQILQHAVDLAEVIDPSTISGDQVRFGATVTVEDESGRERTYQIVGITEASAEHGKISWLSPIGKALLQARSGDVVVARTPQGEEELEITKVQYE